MLVKNFYVKNQFIIEHFGGVTFQSYASEIATITNTGDLYINITKWNYSKTTLKYLYLFLKENLNKLNNNLYEAINFMLNSAKNKKEYFKKLISNGNLYNIFIFNTNGLEVKQ